MNLFQTRLYKYTYPGKKKKITTKFNDSEILVTIISWNYLNLSVANEYIGHVTIPYNMTNVAPGRSANQIAVFTSY
jgi:hypothetical protein